MDASHANLFLVMEMRKQLIYCTYNHCFGIVDKMRLFDLRYILLSSFKRRTIHPFPRHPLHTHYTQVTPSNKSSRQFARRRLSNSLVIFEQKALRQSHT